MIEGFNRAAPIPEESIAVFANRVPAEIVAFWRENGTGWLPDGFFRVVDPAHAETMLDGVFELPAGAVVLFTTALADLVIWIDGRFYLLVWRWGVLDTLPHEGALDDVLRWMRDPELLESWFRWQPYPAAAQRDGVPELDECFGFVPLLALGGPNSADNLQKMHLWVHIAIILQFAGKPRMGGEFNLPA